MSYINRQRHKLHGDLDSIVVEGRLPVIRGTWYFVDPNSGSNNNDGLTKGNAFADLNTAYAACTDEAGDGIVLVSSGNTSAETTSYLTQSLAWAKNGITVVGIASPTRMYGRARIANKEVTTGSITVISFTATTTISRSTGSFIDDGFEVGQKITVASTSTTNDGDYTVAAIASDGLSMTISGGTVSTEDAATAGATEISTYNPEMIVISGDNNYFLNVHVANFSDNAGALGGVKVSGNRNAFANCHFIGAGHATPAAVATAYDLLVDGGQENSFYGCTFGTDTIIRAAANGNIVFDGTAWRTVFEDCVIFAYSETAGKGAIKSVDATAFSGVQIFRRCSFINWNPNGITALTSAFIGTKPNSGNILIDSCSLLGWAAWDSVGGNDTLYVANSDATASGAGGIATTP